tara:strand:- start:306 stop:1319 length:1014 start_codon:yes stop_codon:yes gene_type:complete
MKKFYLKKNNFIKKLFIKLIRKMGFEIIDQNNLNVPTRNKKINENLNILNKKSITLPLGEVKINRNVNSVLVIFRSFTNENKLLSQNKKRLFEKEKKEYTYRSITSICKNLSYTKKEFKNLKIFLKIIDDNSQKIVINKIRKICDKHKISHEISNLEINNYKHKMKFQNNKRMLAHNSHIFQSKEFALKSNYDLLYFVEDDYIHEENALVEMIYSYQKFSSQFKEEIILCPSDYPYLYTNVEYTKNLIGYERHWRQINQSLCTYLISKKTLQKYWSYYEDMISNNYNPYEQPLHNLYKKLKCFSPMPSLALHLTNVNSIYGLSPLKDWIKIWNKNNH